MYSKSLENEAVFTKEEMNNKWNFNFIQNSLLRILLSLLLVEAYLKHLFSYNAKLRRCIYFNMLHILKIYSSEFLFSF